MRPTTGTPSPVPVNTSSEHTTFKPQPTPKFTERNELLGEKATEPEWREGEFTEYGKWMDGWETRRKRMVGHDWCLLQLGVAGVIHGFDVDTRYFTGNYAPRISIQAACLDTRYEGRKNGKMGTKSTDEEMEQAKQFQSEKWTELVPMTRLQPGYPSTSHNYFTVDDKKRYTHIRLNMFPDGGIARFKVYGQAQPDWQKIPDSMLVDLVSMEKGGQCVGYSDAHYGHPRNLISPGRAESMRDGWETARRLDRPPVLTADRHGVLQVPGCEWAEFQLGHPGIIKKIEIDTNHFKGNFPDSCFIEAFLHDGTDKQIESKDWKVLLPAQKLRPHARHFFDSAQIQDIGIVSNVRIKIAPDGGISRLRLIGFKRQPYMAKL